ncbi:MAG: S-methyl-5-thioribose-1-phosphate isomerase, partial [Gammaproteobacteria bacterium]|nr:S-methyl-5-thioribose-1-phosphate isomerase [Gammaproteobacteria bacterium]
IRWHDGKLELLDQRALPAVVTYLEIKDLESGWEAINTLTVRGAPAIGIAAGYILVVAMAAEDPDLLSKPQQFLERLDHHANHLVNARPTAVNLSWAVQRICARAKRSATLKAIREEAENIHEEDRVICRAIGDYGREFIQPDSGVLTHCNAGALAVSELGTATAPLYLNHQQGMSFRVYVDETRPLLQGARLTAWELSEAGMDVTLICDNMAASLMAARKIDLVIVGTDRVTKNGDVVNKIGTLNLAILCAHYNIPFYVACPSSTYDPDTEFGHEVIIEERDPSEVLGENVTRVAVHNPAFDVTPANLVSAIITDRGIARPPLAAALERLLTQINT